MSTVQQKLSEQEAQEWIRKFFEAGRRKKKADEEFSKKKDAFYAAMGGVIDRFGVGASYRFDDSKKHWRVTRSVPTKVVFDIEKLQSKLGKQLSSQVIDVKATIEDLQGLVQYLKSCGVDPKVFKSFISVQKEVNKEALEQLEALGRIDKEDLVGTFEVTIGNPSYRIAVQDIDFK